MNALAGQAGTNAYEILTSLGSRYRRVYRGATQPGGDCPRPNAVRGVGPEEDAIHGDMNPASRRAMKPQ